MFSYSKLSDCVFAVWSPMIGDPSVMGWVTVAAYGVSAALCAAAFRRHSNRTLRIFGLSLAILLVALMVNKQLDLQSALTATGRCLSKMQGWYDGRQRVQYYFILGLLSTSVVLGASLFWMMRRHLPEIWLALLGLIFLLCFVAVRAVGFHKFDVLINIRVNDIRMNWILELGGLVLISVNALWLLLRRSRV